VRDFGGQGKQPDLTCVCSVLMIFCPRFSALLIVLNGLSIQLSPDAAAGRAGKSVAFSSFVVEYVGTNG